MKILISLCLLNEKLIFQLFRLSWYLQLFRFVMPQYGTGRQEHQLTLALLTCSEIQDREVSGFLLKLFLFAYSLSINVSVLALWCNFRVVVQLLLDIVAELTGVAELTDSLDEFNAASILIAELVKERLVVRELAGHTPFAWLVPEMLPADSVLSLLLDVMRNIVAEVALLGSLVTLALEELLANHKLIEHVVLIECGVWSGLLGGQETLQITFELLVRIDVIELHCFL